MKSKTSFQDAHAAKRMASQIKIQRGGVGWFGFFSVSKERDWDSFVESAAGQERLKKLPGAFWSLSRSMLSRVWHYKDVTVENAVQHIFKQRNALEQLKMLIAFPFNQNKAKPNRTKQTTKEKKRRNNFEISPWSHRLYFPARSEIKADVGTKISAFCTPTHS